MKDKFNINLNSFRPLGAPTEPQTEITTTIAPTTDNLNNNNPNFNNNDTEIKPEDLRSTNSPSPSPSLLSHSPRDNPATPTFPETILPPTITPSPNVTPNPTLGPGTPNFSPTKVAGLGGKKSRPPKQETEQVDIPPTKIPEKYHMADQFPIRPHAVEVFTLFIYFNIISYLLLFIISLFVKVLDNIIIYLFIVD